MLVLKKISTKKLAIYISIMVLMFGGTGFMLYQNRKTTNRNPVSIDNYNKLILPTAGDVITDSTGAPNQTLADQAGADKKLSPAIDTSAIKNDSEINSTIFGSEKFKALKENILIPRENIEVGKRDLFKPN